MWLPITICWHFTACSFQYKCVASKCHHTLRKPAVAFCFNARLKAFKFVFAGDYYCLRRFCYIGFRAPHHWQRRHHLIYNLFYENYLDSCTISQFHFNQTRVQSLSLLGRKVLFLILWESFRHFCLGVASLWLLHLTDGIGGELQKWTYFWKVLLSPHRNTGAPLEWTSLRSRQTFVDFMIGLCSNMQRQRSDLLKTGVFKTQVQSTKFTTHGLQPSCGNIGMTCNGNAPHSYVYFCSLCSINFQKCWTNFFFTFSSVDKILYAEC